MSQKIRLVLSLTLSVLVSGCSVFGSQGVEEAPYRVLQKDEAFEIREYAPTVLAETKVNADFDEAGDTSFWRLYGYITGDNERDQSLDMTAPVSAKRSVEIEMTAPVSATRSSDSWAFSFVLPKDFTIANAPKPTNPLVRLREKPSHKVAVLVFSGSWDEQLIAEKTAELKAEIAERGLKINNSPRVAGYDPPWTLPWFRRNEVHFEIAESEAPKSAASNGAEADHSETTERLSSAN